MSLTDYLCIILVILLWIYNQYLRRRSRYLEDVIHIMINQRAEEEDNGD